MSTRQRTRILHGMSRGRANQ